MPTPPFLNEDQLGGPLPIPRQPLGQTVTAPPAGDSLTGILEQRVRAQLEREKNPIYRVMQNFAGTQNQGMQNAISLEQLKGAQQGRELQGQQQQMQMEQFVTNKRLAIGGLAVQFLEKMAAAKPEARAAVMQIGGSFLQPLLKEVGFELPINLLQTFATQPGAVTHFVAAIQSRFGNNPDKVNEVAALVADMSPKEALDFINSYFKSSVDAKLPQIMQMAAEAGRLLLSDTERMRRVGILDEKGNRKPIPLNVLNSVLFEQFKNDPVAHEAISHLLTDPKYGGWLVGQGFESGKLSETVADTIAKEGTPGGQAKIEADKAQAEKHRADVETGKIVPFPEGGGVGRVKDGKYEVLQQPTAKPPGESTRQQIALNTGAVERLKSLQTQIEKNASKYFGEAPRAVAAGKRGLEQVGIATSDAEYEKFWADMNNARAEYLRALEKGNISRSDIDFFLAGWPEKGTAPTAAKKQFSAAVQFAQSKLDALNQEFRGSAAPKPSTGGGTADQRALDKFLPKKK